MSHYRRLTALSLSAAALAGLGLAATTATTEPEPMTYRTITVPSEMPTHAEAETFYRTHLGPSAAWRHADSIERADATAAYLHEFGSLENGCVADLEHAYQGTIADDSLLQPMLGIDLTGEHDDVLFGEYTDGICGD